MNKIKINHGGREKYICNSNTGNVLKKQKTNKLKIVPRIKKKKIQNVFDCLTNIILTNI